MLKTRIITACVLGAMLLLGLFLLPAAGAELAFGAVFVLGAWEWAAFGGVRRPLVRLLYALGIALLLLLTWRWSAARPHLLLVLALACGWWLVALAWLSFAPGRHRPAIALLCGLPVLIPAFLALSRLEVSAAPMAGGPVIILWLVLLVCSGDIGAYFAGRRFGRHKLAPRVSPGKTWEGAIGGLSMTALIALAGALLFDLPAVTALAFGCLIAAFSIVGDLTESMFKRAAGLKDSGSLLPGHGGLLDRIDSVTAAAPLYALGLFGSGVIR